jgi:malonate-semialdehyde dehydrogenase (acetylating)/methylmalonate-semialdehyde dehydrogenase
MDGVRFYTKIKTVTARWPDGATEDQAFIMPTMK